MEQNRELARTILINNGIVQNAEVHAFIDVVISCMECYAEQLNKPCVINQRELLADFANWFYKHIPAIEDTDIDKMVDTYIKSANSL
jgi:hypothetical protein